MNQENQHSINLQGTWICVLDPEDRGLNEEWFGKKLDGMAFEMPGTTNENKLGNPINLDDLDDKEMVKRLRPNYDYIGAAWYQTTIEIPENWCKKNVDLFFERVMFESRVWIDGNDVGCCDSLSTPHEYRITNNIKFGSQHVLTVRIDNRDIQKIGHFASGYTEETQTIWNGIVGKMNLEAKNKLAIEQCKINTKINEGDIHLSVNINNTANIPTNVTLQVQAIPIDRNTEKAKPRQTFDIHITEENTQQTCIYTMDDEYYLWDEHSPNLYQLQLKLMLDTDVLDEKEYNIGLRKFEVNGTQFSVNGKRTFLRGTLECCIFPLTGYPPTTEPYWDKIFKTLKEYGLNHLRFHSWCPPEVAFSVADRYGVYLQVEGPVWMDTWCGMEVGSQPTHYTFLMSEAKKIIDTYGNHPSFCLFSNGNEINGDFTLLHDIIAELKRDNRFCYTLTSNWDRKIDPEDDYFIAQTVDGIGVRGQYYPDEMIKSTTQNYENTVLLRNMPIVSHEVGQYCVYPNMNEIEKYTGNLRPVNFEWIRNDLEQRKLLHKAEDYTYGSGLLAVDLYKEEIEAALRTKGFGGIQLLDLHDFPGQSTATVGILDSFWDSKQLISPDDFKHFCNDIVPLALMEKRIWNNQEVFKFNLVVAHYGQDDLMNENIHWRLIDKNNTVMHEATVKVDQIKQGELNTICSFEYDEFEAICAPIELTLEVEIESINAMNTWKVWVFPNISVDDVLSSNKVTDMKIVYCIDNETITALNQGESILYMPKAERFKQTLTGKYFPPFWSPVHFSSKDSCGILCNKDHSIFEEFPTDHYGNFHWKDIIEHAFSIEYDDFSDKIDTIIDMIPNFFNNRMRTPLFEAKVSKGKLLFCGFDLIDKTQSIERTTLLNSIVNYVNSVKFNPKTYLSLEELDALHQYGDEVDIEELSGVNLAIGKKATADSVLNNDYAAHKGNDGIGHTKWCAEDNESGHWWQVDLGETKQIKGTKVKFEQEANYLYVIQVSENGTDWEVAANQTGQTLTHQTRVDLFKTKARFVRITYNGLPEGIRASHYSFEVY